MVNSKKGPHFLVAAIVFVGAPLASAASALAATNADAAKPAQMIMESSAGAILSEERVRADIDDRYGFQIAKETLDNAVFRVSGNTKKRRHQAAGAQSNANSLQSGATQPPQPAPAGDEMKKILKNIPKPNCGGKHSVC